MRFLTSNRKVIVDTLKVLYLKNVGTSQNLPIYGIKASNLFNYEKTEVDLKKGIATRQPDDSTRLAEEDLIKMSSFDNNQILGLSDLDEDDDSLTAP